MLSADMCSGFTVSKAGHQLEGTTFRGQDTTDTRQIKFYHCLTLAAEEIKSQESTNADIQRM